jgi:NAD(P)-dependent dehydrogenase (short-subunit alcohol dehydrogenase family)
LVSELRHPDLQDTKKIVENEGRKCILIRGDLEAEEHCLEVVQKTVDEYGRIDVLVNNAAFQVKHT